MRQEARTRSRPQARRPRLMQLEERILLDASGLPDSDDTTHDTGDPAHTSAATDESALPDGDPRVLLISSEADPTEALASAALSHVIAIEYDGENATTAELLAEVEAALGGREAASIGIASHGSDAGRMHLAGDAVVALDTLNEPDMAAFWRGLGALTAGDGRIDLLACDVAATDEGSALVDALEALSGRDVAASDDATGNASAGQAADWVLETDDIAVASVYFDELALSAFEGTLVGNPPPALGLLDLSPADLQTTLSVFGNGGGAGDRFGVSIDISGERMIIGEELGGAGSNGQAYIYEWSGTSWSLMTNGTLSAPAAGGQFGHAVAIDGNIAVVSEIAVEAVHIYRYNGTNWVLEGSVEGDADPNDGDRFGESVAVEGAQVAIGAPLDEGNGLANNNGSLWFYTYTIGWISPTQFWGTADNAEYGSSVDMDGVWTVVGSPGSGTGGEVDTLSYGGAWTRQGFLQATDAAAGGRFGEGVAIDGTRLAVGAPGQDGDGAAYVFDNGGAWTQSAKLSASDGVTGDNFGTAVAVDDNLVVVGAPQADPAGVADAGKAYLFVNDGGWAEAGRVQSAAPAAGQQFGLAVEAWLDQALVGGPYSAAGTVAVARTEAQVAENSAGGTVVGLLAANDPEGDTPSYSLIDDAGGRFALNGQRVVLTAAANLDYESATSHTITVQAADALGTRNETFTVHVADVYEAPPPTPAPEPPPVDPDPQPVAPPVAQPGDGPDPIGSDDPGAETDGENEEPGTDAQANRPVIAAASGFDQFLSEEGGQGLSGTLNGIPAAVLTEDVKTPVGRTSDEDDPWRLHSSDQDLLEGLADMAFREELITDASQPEAIRAAFDSILHAYTTSSVELSAYLQSAFRSVAESAVLYGRSTAILDSATSEAERLSSAGWQVQGAVTPLLKALEAARDDVLQATSTLRDAVRGASAAGETGFDRAFEDMVTGAVASLSRSNDQLLAASRIAETVLTSLREDRLAGKEPVPPDAILQRVRDTREQVTAEVNRIRQRWDLTSEDVFAAFIRRLVSERETSPAE